jgi:LuxR family maltose regulon positive regulatory protein
MKGPLCDAVTGREGSARLLRELARSNLFVVPLDEQGEWYRYHHLFSDLLLYELRADCNELGP